LTFERGRRKGGVNAGPRHPDDLVNVRRSGGPTRRLHSLRWRALDGGLPCRRSIRGTLACGLLGADLPSGLLRGGFLYRAFARGLLGADLASGFL
jgi:hypothetical protein